MSGHAATLGSPPRWRPRVGACLDGRDPSPCRRSRLACVSWARLSAAPIDGVKVRGALSPSRAGDFMSCPLLFRFRTIDRLPEGSSPDAVRGTLVHKVLEDIFDLPAAERTPEPRRTPARARLGACCCEPSRRQAREVAADGLDEPAWLDSCRTPCSTAGSPWRTRPGWSRPSARSSSRPCSTPGCSLRGIVDRLDDRARRRAADRRLQDRAARRGEGFESKALFQLRFYALILWRTRGVVPRMLQLVYLGSTSEMRPLRARRGRPARHRAQGRRAVGGDRAGQGDRRLPAQPRQQCDWCAHKAHLPGLGRHAATPHAAVAWAAPRRRPDVAHGIRLDRGARAASAASRRPGRGRRRRRRCRRGAAAGSSPSWKCTVHARRSSLDGRRHRSRSGASGFSARISSSISRVRPAALGRLTVARGSCSSSSSRLAIMARSASKVAPGSSGPVLLEQRPRSRDSQPHMSKACRAARVERAARAAAPPRRGSRP